MSGTIARLAGDGLLLPESTLHSTWFSVLSAFVAINTIVFLALAVAKCLPKVYPRDWLPRTYERSETRSIYPDTPEGEQARREAAIHTTTGEYDERL